MCSELALGQIFSPHLARCLSGFFIVQTPMVSRQLSEKPETIFLFRRMKKHERVTRRVVDDWSCLLAVVIAKTYPMKPQRLARGLWQQRGRPEGQL